MYFEHYNRKWNKESGVLDRMVKHVLWKFYDTAHPETTSDSIKTCFYKLLIYLQISINYVQLQHLQNSESMQAYYYFVSLLLRDGETFFSNTERGTNFLSFKLSTFVVSLVK